MYVDVCVCIQYLYRTEESNILRSCDFICAKYLIRKIQLFFAFPHISFKCMNYGNQFRAHWQEKNENSYNTIYYVFSLIFDTRQSRQVSVQARWKLRWIKEYEETIRGSARWRWQCISNSRNKHGTFSISRRTCLPMLCLHSYSYLQITFDDFAGAFGSFGADEKKKCEMI